MGDMLNRPLFWTLLTLGAIAAVTLAFQEVSYVFHPWVDALGR